ncbi:MAG TPA: large-conductance mechanosensitive channel protein MscL [Clostridia bacterium]|jgi:large conductance mechanosensitive channel|nr:MAG: Large-conductance mechanosensitive channel [Firmicutes bacterium ADurb.Bin146]HOD92292.1 large-conductance mechanosensitive channel protein MscL [Clostridia bacterium]HQM38711.1 large-conductance mechanosensitive channel protein MscL [Clostridia bacterium]
MRKRIKKERVKLIEEFKKFITKGNVIDLAVGVIIGAAFSKIVSSLVNDIIMPLVGLIMGKVNFKELKWILTYDAEGNAASSVNYGMFIQYVVDFLIMAVCVFLLVKLFAVLRKKADEMKEKAKKEEEKNIQPPAPPAPPAPSAQELLLTEIRDILKATK